MKTILYAILLISIIECAYTNKPTKPAVNAKKQKRECIKEFEQDAKRYWHYNAQTGMYVADSVFDLKLKQPRAYTCLRGLDTSYVYKILGRQHTQFDNDFPRERGASIDSLWSSIRYTMVKDDRYENSVQIIFTKKGKVARIFYKEMATTSSY